MVQTQLLLLLNPEVGANSVETALNLKNYLLQLKQIGFKIDAYILPGADTTYEKSTVLVNFENSAEATLSSDPLERVFTWLFKKLPAIEGEYEIRDGYENALVLDGFGGTYFGHPFVPGLNGISQSTRWKIPVTTG